jgi:hypothetical protein
LARYFVNEKRKLNYQRAEDYLDYLERFGFVPAGGAITFGALTPVGEGDAATSEADGTYGEFTVAGGVMTPNTSPLTVGDATVGSTTVTVEAGYRTYGKLADITSILGLSAANKSGLTVKGRPGTYATTNGAFNGAFNDPVGTITFDAMNPANPPIWTQAAVFTSVAPTTDLGDVIFKSMEFYRPADGANESKRTGNFTTGTATACVIVENTHAVRDIVFDTCTFRSNYPIARQTGLRADTDVAGVWAKGNLTGITIQDCTFNYLKVGAQLTGANMTFRRNLHRYCWDDMVRIVATSSYNCTTVSITDNVAFDFIGDHGFHPDGVHIYESSAGLVDGITIQGNIIFPGTEGHLAPAWSVNPIGGGAFTRDSTLTTATPTLTDADSNRFIFMDATAASRTVTLSDQSLAASDFAVQIQSWSTNGTAQVTPNTITIDRNGETLYDIDAGANTTSDPTMIEPWETVILRVDKANSRWTITRAGPEYQGIFSNAITNGIDNATIKHNIIWQPGSPNAIRIESANSDTATIENNTLITPWPGDLNGSGRANSASQGGPTSDLQIRHAGTNADANGNIASSLEGNAAGVTNTLTAQVNLQTWSDISTAFDVDDAGVEENYPTTKLEAIAKARPISGGGVVENSGAVAYVQSNDPYNFGHIEGEALGERGSSTWSGAPAGPSMPGNPSLLHSQVITGKAASYATSSFTPSGDPLVVFVHRRSDAVETGGTDPTINIGAGAVTATAWEYANRHCVEAYFIASPGTSPVTLTHTPGQQGNGVRIQVYEVSGASAMIAGTSSISTNATTRTPSVTTAQDNSLAMYAATASNAALAVTNATSLYDDAAINTSLESGSAGWEQVATAGAADATFTRGGSGEIVSVAVEVQGS